MDLPFSVRLTRKALDSILIYLRRSGANTEKASVQVSQMFELIEKVRERTGAVFLSVIPRGGLLVPVPAKLALGFPDLESLAWMLAALTHDGRYQIPGWRLYHDMGCWWTFPEGGKDTFEQCDVKKHDTLPEALRYAGEIKKAEAVEWAMRVAKLSSK